MMRRVLAGLFAFFLAAAGAVVAGTTGRITGVVKATDGKAVAAASVSVVSPSQTSTTTTDASGHFAFISVSPDTYNVSVSKSGYDPLNLVAVVQADQSIVLTPTLRKSLRTIASVNARAAGALVRPGTTYDV